MQAVVSKFVQNLIFETLRHAFRYAVGAAHYFLARRHQIIVQRCPQVGLRPAAFFEYTPMFGRD